MSVKQDGLGRRLSIEARRISSQHRQLDELYGVVLDALTHSSPRSIRDSFARFRDALEAHFSMEDDVHFPALHGLRPGLEAALTELVEEHKLMRRSLDAVQAHFAADEVEAGAEHLDALVVRLARHEETEERLLDGLEPPSADD